MTRSFLSHFRLEPQLKKGASALWLAGTLIGLAILAGCQPKGTVQASTAPPAAPKEPSMAQVAAPVIAPLAAPQGEVRTPNGADPKQEEAAGGRVTIAGGWVNAGGACDSGASVFFNSDGTYMSEGEKGTWALSGKTLTVTTSITFDEAAPMSQGTDESTGDTGEKSVLTLLSVTDDAARVVLSNGSNANWTRCNG